MHLILVQLSHEVMQVPHCYMVDNSARQKKVVADHNLNARTLRIMAAELSTLVLHTHL